MVPQFTQGVFSQKFWRGVGDIDDCAVLAVLACIHGCAPWLTLPGVTAYRDAAGNPDDPNSPDGLTIGQSVQAITKLWPKIAPLLTASKGTGTWADFIASLKAGRCAVASVYSASMATSGGLPIRHSVSVYWNGSLRLVNPLRAPHSLGTVITETALKKAMDDFPEQGLFYILFPTVEDAFKTHPLYR